ncbi:FG-GAP-like repeat-containing protein, partial [Pseudoalteromonas rubra]
MPAIIQIFTLFLLLMSLSSMADTAELDNAGSCNDYQLIEIYKGQPAEFTIHNIQHRTANPTDRPPEYDYTFMFRKESGVYVKKENGYERLSLEFSGITSDTEAGSPRVTLLPDSLGTHEFVLTWTDNWFNRGTKPGIKNAVRNGKCRVKVQVNQQPVAPLISAIEITPYALEGAFSPENIPASRGFKISFSVTDRNNDLAGVALHQWTVSDDITALRNALACTDIGNNKDCVITLPGGTLSEGHYAFSVSATDRANHTTKVLGPSFNITNNQPPKVLLNPEAVVVGVGQPVKVAVTVTDADNANGLATNKLSQVIYKVDDRATPVNCAANKNCQVSVDMGEVTRSLSVEFTATDGAGGTGTALLPVTYCSLPEARLDVSSQRGVFPGETLRLTAIGSVSCGEKASRIMICRAPYNTQYAPQKACSDPITEFSLESDTCTENDPCHFNYTLPGASNSSVPGYTFYSVAVDDINQQVGSVPRHVALGQDVTSSITLDPGIAERGHQVLVGEPVRFTVAASAHSAAVNSIAIDQIMLRLDGNSNQAEPLNIQVALTDNPHCPQDAQPPGSIRLCRGALTYFDVTWTPAQAYHQATVKLLINDNTGNVNASSIATLKVSYPASQSPATPLLDLLSVENGRKYQAALSRYGSSRELDIKYRKGGSEFTHHTIKTGGNPTSVYSIYSDYDDNLKTLEVCARGVNYAGGDRNAAGADVIFGEEICKTAKIEYAKPVPRTRVFNNPPKQVGEAYSLHWTGLIGDAYYELDSWPGSLAEKARNHDRGTLRTTRVASNTFEISKPMQGQHSYELRACNSQGTCSVGEQITVEHMVPLITEATLVEVDAGNDAMYTLTVKGHHFGAGISQVYLRLRATGETFTLEQNTLRFEPGKVEATIDPEKQPRVIAGYKQGGLYLAIDNGVYRTQDVRAKASTMLNGEGSEAHYALRDAEVSLSDNGYLYTGTAKGLVAYKIADENLTYQWTHPVDQHLIAGSGAVRGVTGKPLVHSTPEYDELYFGTLTHKVLKVRHRFNVTDHSFRHAERWRFSTRGAVTAGLQMGSKQELYVPTMEGVLYALDASTGGVYWHYEFADSGGIDTTPRLTSDGSLWVTTQDGVTHQLDRSRIASEAVAWDELLTLSDEYAKELEEWKSRYWHPGQSYDEAIAVAKAYYIIMQKAPSKAQLSFLTYLLTQGYSLDGVVSTILKGNSELIGMKNQAFVTELFRRVLNQPIEFNDPRVLGNYTQAGWLANLNANILRSTMVIHLLEAASEQYNQVVYSLLYYFYDYCNLANDCVYYGDADQDGLNDAVEALLGTNPLNADDGLRPPTLTIPQGTSLDGSVHFQLDGQGVVHTYQIEESLNNQSFRVAAEKPAEDNQYGAGNSAGDQTEFFLEKGNGNYRFRAKSCVSVTLNNDPQLHCSVNYSNEVSLNLTNSAVDKPINVSLPYLRAHMEAPDDHTLRTHASLSATTGSFRVSESGSATYSVPIALPQGIAGVTPEVSLSYQGHTADSGLGLGWAVNAGSSITRCRQTMAQDQQFQALMFNDEDRYCLDGQRLINTGERGQLAGHQVDTLYVTEVDSHLSVGKVGDMFIVQGKDGAIKYYGKTPNSKIKILDEDGRGHTLSWMLDSVYDNLKQEQSKIEYVYRSLEPTEFALHDRPYTADKVLDYIRYSGNQVKFNYNQGPVRNVSLVDGVYVLQLAQLTSIEVFNHNHSLLSRYQLDFEQFSHEQNQSGSEGSSYKQRVLTQIQQCRGVCKLPIKFGYLDQSGETDFENARTLLHHSGTISGFTLADLNADGKPETIALYKNKQDKEDKHYQLCVSGVSCVAIERKDGAEFVSLAVFDHDNDGAFSILVNVQSDYDASADEGKARVYWRMYELAAGRLVQVDQLPFDDVRHYMGEMQFADMNGDGYADAVFKDHYHAVGQGLYTSIYNPQTNTYLPAVAVDPYQEYDVGRDTSNDLMAKGAEWRVLDMNFDGLSDVVVLRCNKTVDECDTEPKDSLTVYYNKGTFAYEGNHRFYPLEVRSFDYAQGISSLTAADVNSDGLTDFIFFVPDTEDSDKGEWRVLLNLSSQRYEFEQVFTLSATKDKNDMAHAIRADFSPIVADLDKNGQVELLFKASRPNEWSKYEWSPKDVTLLDSKSTLHIAGVDDPKKDSAFFADHNGDGITDLIVKSPDQLQALFNRNVSAHAGLLKHIIQGHGNRTDIDYEVMTSSLVYGGQLPSLPADQALFDEQQLLVVHPMSARPLVQKVTTDSPSSMSQSERRSVAYRYYGAALQFGGRGWLGFKALETTMEKSSLQSTRKFVTTTRYHQAFPLTGMPASTVKKMDSRLLSTARNTYRHTPVSYAGQIAKSYQVYMSQVRECEAQLDSYLQSTGYACSDSDTTQDEFGNVTDTQTTQFYLSNYPESFISGNDSAQRLSHVKTTNVFATDWQAKWFGRLQSSTVEHKNWLTNKSQSQTAHFTYYPQGAHSAYLLESETTAKGLGCQYELTKTYEYDVVGNQIKVATENSGCANDKKQTRYVRHKYDEDMRYIEASFRNFKEGEKEEEKTDESGDQTEFEVLSGSKVLARNAFGQPTQLESVSGAITTQVYDVFGGTIGSYSVSGAQSYSYATACSANADVQCALVRHTVVNNELLEVQYVDRLGRVFAKSTRTALGGWLTSTVTYDRYGRAIMTTAPGAQAVTTDYDVLDRVVRSTDPNADTVSNITHSAFTMTTELLYGSTNHVNQTVDKTQVHSVVYNKLGQVYQEVDTLGQTLTHSYDVMGRRELTRSSADNNAVVMRLSYDRLGRKASQQDNDRGRWTYQYSAFGELLEQTDARGVKTEIKYDLLGRKIKQTQITSNVRAYAGSTLNQNSVMQEGVSEWHYGISSATAHLLLYATQGGSDWRQVYYYDDLHRPAATLTGLDNKTHCEAHVQFNSRLNDLRLYNKIDSKDNPVADPLDSLCVISQTAYDEYGRTALSLDDYRRYENGQFEDVRGLQLHYQFGQVVRRQEAREGEYGTVYYGLMQLNQRGQVSDYHKGAVSMRLNYDSSGMLSGIASQSSYRYLQQDSYQFDGIGTLVSRQLTNQNRENFGYDALNRLTRVNGASWYSYAGNGNLLSKPGGEHQWHYDYQANGVANHRLTKRSYEYTRERDPCDGGGGGDQDTFGNVDCPLSTFMASSGFNAGGFGGGSWIGGGTPIGGGGTPIGGGGTPIGGGDTPEPIQVEIKETFAYDRNGNETRMISTKTEDG